VSNDKQPGAVLFDLGGVLFEGVPRETGFTEVSGEIFTLLGRHRSNGLDRAQIEADIRAGTAAYEAWKYAQSRMAEPAEIAHRVFWEDFVAADWPRGARLTVSAHAVPLCNLLEDSLNERPARLGMGRILERLAGAGIPAGIISNSLGAQSRRDLVRRHGFDDFLGVQIYSDEIGIRKPHPRFFSWACDCLGVPLEDTWYVGDTLDRDILGARRAGIGRAVLISSRLTGSGPQVDVKPDDAVEDAEGLEELLRPFI
jgi:N-acetyl-D-muramate 6-phosphate phosphatase